MGKYCIFCDSAERSAEHIFPSCFGGRLTSKRIYCATHNLKLGLYVAILDKKIGVINNLFGISPDRGDAKPIKLADTKTGEFYLRDNKGKITFSAIDNVDESQVLNGVLLEVSASSNEDIKRLQEHFKKKHHVNLEVSNKGVATKEIMKNQLTVSIDFGDIDFFKSTLYLLITFLAHYDRNVINAIDMSYIADILLRNNESEILDFVSLESFHNFLEDDDEQVMHSFAFIKNSNNLYGTVSYFNSVTYVIKIGELVGDFSNFVVYVYPLKHSNNPNDAMVKQELSSAIEVAFNPSGLNSPPLGA